MNKIEESRIIDRFRKAYSGFPDGHLSAEPPPLPDFVLTQGTGLKIGIEITEVFHSNAQKQWSSIKNSITDKLVVSLQRRLPYKFTLTVTIDSNRPMLKAKQDDLIEDLSNICHLEFALLPDNEYGEISHIDFDLHEVDPAIASLIRQEGYRNLPSGIAGIRIHRYDRLPYSYNSQNEGGLVPVLRLADIQHIMIKKEKLLAKQPALDQNWLVIREGNYFTGTFSEIRIDLPLNSTFGKVFLFRTQSDQVVQLK